MTEDIVYTFIAYAITLLVFALLLRALLRYIRRTMHPTRPFWPTLLLFAGGGLGAVYASAVVATVALLLFFDATSSRFYRLGTYVAVAVFLAIMFWVRRIIRSPLGAWVGDEPATRLGRALVKLIRRFRGL